MFISMSVVTFPQFIQGKFSLKDGNPSELRVENLDIRYDTSDVNNIYRLYCNIVLS